MENDKKYVVCDFADTLNGDIELMDKLVQLKRNNIDICIATGYEEDLFIKQFGKFFDVFDLPLKDLHLMTCNKTNYIKKDDEFYWPVILKRLKTEAQSIIFIDDEEKNCKNAIKNGISTIQYKRGAGVLEQLDQLLVQKSFVPV